MHPVFIKTFGCKVNYTESVDAAAQLARLGITAREMTGASLPEGTADCTVVVNSCCVTKEAERKALQFVRRMARRYPGARVLFTGCAARHDEIQRRFSEAGAQVLASYPEVIDALHRVTPGLSTNAPDEDDGSHGAAFGQHRVRAFLKIQDGCTCRCSYCIIPDVRPYYTRPLGSILTEVQQRCADDYRELVLTGINAGCYGRAPLLRIPGVLHPEGPVTVCDVIESVLAVLPEQVRLRLSSIEPEDVDDRLIGLLGHPRFCEHLHLPLQSGSDAVLADMGRPYTAARYSAVVDRIRSAHPEAAVTTDIITGYPTETPADFERTLELCSHAGFERVHCFPFSPRPGTPAAELKPLPGNEVRERNRRLIEHCTAVAARRWARFTDTTAEVLVEGLRDGEYTGHGAAYQVVRLPGDTPGIEPGGCYAVRLTSLKNGEFLGEPV